MAILGVNGEMRLRREAPDPIVIPSSSLNAEINAFALSDQTFWSGDEVYLYSPTGIPIAIDAVPGGVATYFGSKWELGTNRAHITSYEDEFYQDDDGVDFYLKGNPINSASFFVYRDLLDRLSLYTTRAAALNGGTADRVDLFRLDFGAIVLYAAGTAEYDNAIVECVTGFGDYDFSDIRDEVTLASICDFPPDYLQPVAGSGEYDNAEISPRRWVSGFPWFIICNLREWTIELDGANIDSTAVGQKFGENVKSIITGGGSLDFIVQRLGSDTTYDPTVLMKLLFLTEKGAQANAQFYMGSRADRDNACSTDGLQVLPGDLYYECDILLTNIAINTRVDEIIAGTAQFVTTGPIQLRMGT